MESKFIAADMIEATEFPHLVQKYGVSGVPRTVINENFSVEGVAPEEKILSEITRAIQKPV
jgi:predicted DsbA family dithiol-disulfide isomerase